VIPVSILLAATAPRPARTELTANLDYWLARCQGFSVATEDGKLGVVQSIGYRPGCTGQAILLIHGGVFAGRSSLIEARDVVGIDAKRRRVDLRLGYRETPVAPVPGFLARTIQRLIPQVQLRRAHP